MRYFEIDGKRYYRVGRDCKIKEGAIHQHTQGGLYPILSPDTVGQRPCDFSDLRDFYNPAPVEVQLNLPFIK